MLKLILLVILEAAIGLAVGGGLLAVIVPLLIARHVIVQGDLTGAVLIGAVLALAVGAALFRPGSALRRSKN